MKKKMEKTEMEIMVIAVSIDIICILWFYDNCSCVTYLIWKTMILHKK